MSKLDDGARLEEITTGIALRLASVGCYSIMAVLLKLASHQGVVAGEMLFYRSIFGLPVVLVWVIFNQDLSVLSTRRPLAHVGRSAVGIVSVLCMSQALIMLPLADTIAIGFTAPAFATILSWLLLREHVGKHRWLSVLVGFVGVVVVVQPGSSGVELPLPGVAAALVAALGTAGVIIALRQLRHTEHVAAIVFWFFAACTGIGALFLPFIGQVHETGTLLLLAAAGISGGFMQITLTASLQHAPVSLLSSLDYLQIVGALVLGWLILNELPPVSTLAGACLIIISGLNIAWREHRSKRRSSSVRTETVR